MFTAYTFGIAGHKPLIFNGHAAFMSSSVQYFLTALLLFFYKLKNKIILI